VPHIARRIHHDAKHIRILAPMIGTKRKKDKEADKDITKQNEPVLVVIATNCR
jgi:hypothetical protein